MKAAHPCQETKMAALIYAFHQSLDGYVDHRKLGPPDPVVFGHFLETTRALTAFLYGGRMYEIMRYWDEDQEDWDSQELEFAAAWRSKPKWVLSRSRSLSSVGPNATLLAGDPETAIRELKAASSGEIFVGGPALAQILTSHGLIDEYRVYLRPAVLGGGRSAFDGPTPPLQLRAVDRIGPDVARLTYVPA
jgi:dihydrofolate reductase